MKLILRPLMPPSAFTFLKEASIVLPIVPYADAGPLYGLVLPILISVSVAPGPYFLPCASAGLAAAASVAAAEANNLRLVSCIISSPLLAAAAAVSLMLPFSFQSRHS